MIILILSIAAFANAVMDVLKDKFSSSIFRNLDENFWNPAESWKNKYKNRKKEDGRKYAWFLSGLTDTFSDAWHMAKLILILCIVIGFSLEKEFSYQNILIYFGVWGAIFWFFYVWVLVKQE